MKSPVIPAANLVLQTSAKGLIAARIAHLQAEIVTLQQAQRAHLVDAIRFTIGPGVAFTARELFQYRVVNPDLAAAFDDAGIDNARVLGKRLRALCGHGLDRVGADHDGALWTCSVAT